MAWTHINIDRVTRRSARWAGARNVVGMFAGAAFVGAFGVVAAALFLPNAPVFPVSLAVMFYAVSATVAGWAMYRSYPHNRVGWCNYLTLIRLVLVSALLVPLISGSAPSWAFFAVAAVALSVDGLDGWFARREGLASEFGARFDVEVDSLLALVLALNAAFNTDVGLWVVLFGLPRYAFGLAGMALPWMRGDLPERFSRKVVCVLQLATLIALQAPILPQVLIVMLVPVVALALIWSFALDILWLWRSRR